MAKFQIINTVSGLDLDLGVFEASNESAALDAFAREAGYEDYAAACEVAPATEEEIEVTEVA